MLSYRNSNDTPSFARKDLPDKRSFFHLNQLSAVHMLLGLSRRRREIIAKRGELRPSRAVNRPHLIVIDIRNHAALLTFGTLAKSRASRRISQRARVVEGWPGMHTRSFLYLKSPQDDYRRRCRLRTTCMRRRSLSPRLTGLAGIVYHDSSIAH